MFCCNMKISDENLFENYIGLLCKHSSFDFFLRNRKTIGTSTIDDDGIKTMITNNLQSDPEYRSMIKVLLN